VGSDPTGDIERIVTRPAVNAVTRTDVPAADVEDIIAAGAAGAKSDALGEAGKGERVSAAEKQVVDTIAVERGRSAGKGGGGDIKTGPSLGVAAMGELKARNGATRGQARGGIGKARAGDLRLDGTVAGQGGYCKTATVGRRDRRNRIIKIGNKNLPD